MSSTLTGTGTHLPVRAQPQDAEQRAVRDCADEQPQAQPRHLRSASQLAHVGLQRRLPAALSCSMAGSAAPRAGQGAHPQMRAEAQQEGGGHAHHLRRQGSQRRRH